MKKDVFGLAISDYYHQKYQEDITTLYEGEEDSISIPYLFRDFKSMPSLEQYALTLCKGNILDVGCGAGSHSLYLQDQKALDVTAIDISAQAIEIVKKRGVKNAKCTSIFEVKNQQFDTILMLMNGIGIAKKLAGVGPLLDHLKGLLSPKGQILIDSSDLIYIYEIDEDSAIYLPADKAYYGELDITMSYKNLQETVSWVYVDFKNLQLIAKEVGLKCDLLKEGEHYDFLVRLTHLV
jgi:SAM-dependent methyltransferase